MGVFIFFEVGILRMHGVFLYLCIPLLALLCVYCIGMQCNAMPCHIMCVDMRGPPTAKVNKAKSTNHHWSCKYLAITYSDIFSFVACNEVWSVRPGFQREPMAANDPVNSSEYNHLKSSEYVSWSSYITILMAD